MLFWQSKTPVISVCPIQITLQLETARLNDCSRNQAKQAAYRNNATRVFSENLERQTGGGHVIKPCGHVRSSQRAFSTPRGRFSRKWFTWTFFILNLFLCHAQISLFRTSLDIFFSEWLKIELLVAIRKSNTAVVWKFNMAPSGWVDQSPE